MAELAYEIRDRTSQEGMTERAQNLLNAALQGASQAGLGRLAVVAARGGGHKSHSQGTEYDLIGYNPDGSKWNHAQRVAVAAAWQAAGGDRFGIYDMDNGLGRGTLHLGYSGPGRPAAFWGAKGLTGGPASRKYTNPAERSFFRAASRGKQFLQDALQLVGNVAVTAITGIDTVTEEQAAAQGGPEISKTQAKAIQVSLNAGGYRDRKGNPLAIDGDIGPETKHAMQQAASQAGSIGPNSTPQQIRAVQAALHGMGIQGADGEPLKLDGIIGPNTEHAIRASSGFGNPVEAARVPRPRPDATITPTGPQRTLLGAEVAPNLLGKPSIPYTASVPPAPRVDPRNVQMAEQRATGRYAAPPRVQLQPTLAANTSPAHLQPTARLPEPPATLASVQAAGEAGGRRIAQGGAINTPPAPPVSLGVQPSTVATPSGVANARVNVAHETAPPARVLGITENETAIRHNAAPSYVSPGAARAAAERTLRETPRPMTPPTTGLFDTYAAPPPRGPTFEPKPDLARRAEEARLRLAEHQTMNAPVSLGTRMYASQNTDPALAEAAASAATRRVSPVAEQLSEQRELKSRTATTGTYSPRFNGLPAAPAVTLPISPNALAPADPRYMGPENLGISGNAYMASPKAPYNAALERAAPRAATPPAPQPAAKPLGQQFMEQIGGAVQPVKDFFTRDPFTALADMSNLSDGRGNNLGFSGPAFFSMLERNLPGAMGYGPNVARASRISAQRSNMGPYPKTSPTQRVTGRGTASTAGGKKSGSTSSTGSRNASSNTGQRGTPSYGNKVAGGPASGNYTGRNR